MPSPDEESFRKIWPKCIIVLLAIIELLGVAALCLSELGNVAANFWTTNVFAGGWCGIIVLVHMFSLFVAGCCLPTPPAAFRAAVIAIISIVACVALIGFDVYFIIAPTTCLLTSSCTDNSGSNTTFSYSFQQSFFRVFNSWGPFKSYTESYTKFFFHVIQLCIGALCLILCIIYVVMYYLFKNKAKVPQESTSPQSSSNYRYASQARAPQKAAPKWNVDIAKTPSTQQPYSNAWQSTDYRNFSEEEQ